MAHRKTPSVNENWVREETVNETKKAAQRNLQKCKEYEAEHRWKWEKISDFPKTYKRVIL